VATSGDGSEAMCGESLKCSLQIHPSHFHTCLYNDS